MEVKQYKNLLYKKAELFNSKSVSSLKQNKHVKQ